MGVSLEVVANLQHLLSDRESSRAHEPGAGGGGASGSLDPNEQQRLCQFVAQHLLNAMLRFRAQNLIMQFEFTENILLVDTSCQ